MEEQHMSRKRIRVPKAKPGELIACWGRPDRGEDPDLVYAWGGKGADSSDGRILSNALENAVVFDGRTLKQELMARGYDITTLRFSILQHQTEEPEQSVGDTATAEQMPLA
jgi:hypothetical protein